MDLDPKKLPRVDAAVSGLQKRMDAFEESKHPRAANGQFGSRGDSGFDEGKHPRSENGQFGSAVGGGGGTSADTIHPKAGSKSSNQESAHKIVSAYSPFKEGPPVSVGRGNFARKYNSHEKPSPGGTSHALSVEPNGAWKHHEQFTAGTRDKVHGSGSDAEGLKSHLQNYFGSGG